ncbi:hypothetical protein BD410DRAFT_788874 [Rickenella mellea]|uniref:MYND-type domain-containing protein n=1 Tax=Rickenella mellea TaxID=50990 RepID=A0A4Y7Q453_9AGAM|nr:hypothetical protein BD410DRAFT_788874 [Rickenella mellea]
MSVKVAPYSIIQPPPLSKSELICKVLDDDVTDMLIDKWLEHRNDAYFDWFNQLRDRKMESKCFKGQMLAWNKGDFVPENFFCRTVDTGRLIPLDRTWTTHVYHHRTMQDRKLSMMPVLYTMLPEIMLLRGMHDQGCDHVWIIVTDMNREEMDDVTEYFKLVCRANTARLKQSMERKIRREHNRIVQALHSQFRLPCFPQIDITFRAILNEHKPPFIILFSHQTTSYSQIFFTSPSYVPSDEIFYDFPSGCPNPDCSDDCEMVRFPRRGVEHATILSLKKGDQEVKAKNMCNWVDCKVCFSSADEEGSDDNGDSFKKVTPMKCSKCKLVLYCSAEHQKYDWDEHKRVCVKIVDN